MTSLTSLFLIILMIIFSSLHFISSDPLFCDIVVDGRLDYVVTFYHKLANGTLLCYGMIGKDTSLESYIWKVEETKDTSTGWQLIKMQGFNFFRYSILPFTVGFDRMFTTKFSPTKKIMQSLEYEYNLNNTHSMPKKLGKIFSYQDNLISSAKFSYYPLDYEKEGKRDAILLITQTEITSEEKTDEELKNLPSYSRQVWEYQLKREDGFSIQNVSTSGEISQSIAPKLWSSINSKIIVLGMTRFKSNYVLVFGDYDMHGIFCLIHETDGNDDCLDVNNWKSIRGAIGCDGSIETSSTTSTTQVNATYSLTSSSPIQENQTDVLKSLTPDNDSNENVFGMVLWIVILTLILNIASVSIGLAIWLNIKRSPIILTEAALPDIENDDNDEDLVTVYSDN